jgi:hypothetical protein
MKLTIHLPLRAESKNTYMAQTYTAAYFFREWRLIDHREKGVDVIIHKELTINSISKITPIRTLISHKCTDHIYFEAVALNHE